MSLFWIVHEIDGRRVVFVQEAHGPAVARLKASMAGFAGEFVEIHALDSRTAKRVPKEMRGRALSQEEAAALLQQLG